MIGQRHSETVEVGHGGGVGGVGEGASFKAARKVFYSDTHIPLVMTCRGTSKSKLLRGCWGRPQLYANQFHQSILDNAQSCLNWKPINTLSCDVSMCYKETQTGSARAHCVNLNFFWPNYLSWSVLTPLACTVTGATLPFVQYLFQDSSWTFHVRCLINYERSSSWHYEEKWQSLPFLLQLLSRNKGWLKPRGKAFPTAPSPVCSTVCPYESLS